jgi:hypothetical protein
MLCSRLPARCTHRLRYRQILPALTRMGRDPPGHLIAPAKARLCGYSASPPCSAPAQPVRTAISDLIMPIIFSYLSVEPGK